MNRTEFMNQLEILLRDISVGEKEEALQYYNDYFDDAGAENEQNVIEALGNPARVAENIRRELLENQSARSSTAADRAVVEYGKTDIDEQTGEMPMVKSVEGYVVEMPVTASEIRISRDTTDGRSGAPERAAFSEGGAGSGGGSGREGSVGSGGDPGWAGNAGSGVNPGWGGSPGSGGNSGWGGSPGSGGDPGWGGNPGSEGKPGMSGGMIALMAVLVVFASPFIIGLLSIMFGLLVMWFALILSFGMVVLSMFIVLFVLLIVGGMCIPVDPLVGLALIGGGLICGGIGLLFLMLTVAMAGIATPAIFRGIGYLFRLGKKRAVA